MHGVVWGKERIIAESSGHRALKSSLMDEDAIWFQTNYKMSGY